MYQWSSITVAAGQPIGRYSATVPIIAPISLAGAISISNTVPMRGLTDITRWRILVAAAAGSLAVSLASEAFVHQDLIYDVGMNNGDEPRAMNRLSWRHRTVRLRNREVPKHDSHVHDSCMTQ